MKYTMEQRARLYNASFIDYPVMWHSKNWLLGVWSVGACYKGSGWHGAYPYKYLKRMRSLFPEVKKNKTLHLFSGSLSPGYDSENDWAEDFPGITFDKNESIKPDVVGDAEEVSEYFKENTFDMILADCPYTDEDANKYGFPLISRNKVVKECYKILKPGGHLCWLDMVLPMYKKTEFKRVGEISISRSTNHRVRAVFVFEKVK